MTDEHKHIEAAAAALDDPYAALSQHLHGDGDAPPAPLGCGLPCGYDCNGACFELAHSSPRPDACATPGCPHPSAIRLDDRRLCQRCYATHDFGDDA